jgi:Predicted metal-dependent hydrolase of the TIM-barrel fold
MGTIIRLFSCAAVGFSLASLSAHAERRPKPDQVFDVHLHALKAESFPDVSGANFGAHRKTATGQVRDSALLLQKTLEEMNHNHVRQALISGDPVVVRRWAETHPDRFLASYDPDLSLSDQAAAVAQFEKEAREGRWRAMGELGLPYAGRPLNDPTLFPYYDACQRLGIPVFFHTGLDGPEPQKLVSPAFRVDLGDPLLLQDVAIKFPRLRIVIMHMGWPFFDHALYMLYAYPNVYLDTAVVNWILGRQVFDCMLREAVDTVGSDRILFGSDQMVWPQKIGPAVSSIRDATYLSETDKHNILWGNAARLLGLSAK